MLGRSPYGQAPYNSFEVSSGSGSVAAAAGVGAAAGIGSSLAASTGAASGTGTASGVGASSAASIGSASGTGAASGVGSSIAAGDGVGSATGTGTAAAVAAIIANALGAASGSGTALGISPPPVVVDTGPGGSVGVGRFTRGRWRQLKDEWAALAQAQEAAELKAQEVTGKRRSVLEAVAKAAGEALLAHEANAAAEHAAEAGKLARLVEGAIGAQFVSDMVKAGNVAIARAVKLQEEIEEDDEEESIMLMLLS